MDITSAWNYMLFPTGPTLQWESFIRLQSFNHGCCTHSLSTMSSWGPRSVLKEWKFRVFSYLGPTCHCQKLFCMLPQNPTSHSDSLLNSGRCFIFPLFASSIKQYLVDLWCELNNVFCVIKLYCNPLCFCILLQFNFSFTHLP